MKNTDEIGNREVTTEKISDEQSETYVSKNLGIKFQYPQGFIGQAVEQGNEIMVPSWSPIMYIAVFEKSADETIENSILNIVKNEGKDPKNCKVVLRDTEKSGNQEYVIDLATPITYTKEEQTEIRLADKNWTPDAGPVNGDYKKMEIYNKRLIDNCSSYADPLGLATSTTAPSMFLYNDSQSKTKFVFLPGSADPYFHEYGTIEFINEPEVNTDDLTKSKEENRYVYYNGTITVSGKYHEWSPDGLLGGILCFYPDETTGHLIPRDPDMWGPGQGDERIPWFCFKDQEKAKEMFGLNDDEIFSDKTVECLEGKATVTVSNYVVDKMESSVFDTAELNKIVSKEAFKTTCEQI